MLEIRIQRDGRVDNVTLDLKEVVIGRRNEERGVDLDLSPDDSVSRIHARVWEKDSVLYLEDLGSSGGTIIEGHVVDEGKIVDLDPNTEVIIGKAYLNFCITQPVTTSKEPGIHVERKTDMETFSSVFDLDELFIGRKHSEHIIHIDLSSDLKASRIHARIWRTRDICWVEDLNSTHGTTVNGETLNGARTIGPEDVVCIGESQIRLRYEHGSVEGSVKPVPRESKQPPSRRDEADKCKLGEMDSYPVYKEEGYRYFPPGQRGKSEFEDLLQSRKSPLGRISLTCEISLSEDFQKGNESSKFLDLLPGMVKKMNTDLDSKSLCEWFVYSVPTWTSGAERVSIYVIDNGTKRINLLAHKPALKPILSDILAHRALEEKCAFAWQQVSEDQSVRRLSINAGMYVPLVTLGQEVGLICVEDTSEGAQFSLEQLAQLNVVGQLLSLPLYYRLINQGSIEH